jgi:two-component system KDP operon response regulator KdpE
VSAGPEPAPAGPFVRLVDDEPQVRRFLRTSLPAAGFRCLEAASGAEAQRMASQYVPDVVLLDPACRTGGPRGRARARQWAAARSLVLSARGQEPREGRLLDRRRRRLLTKPFGFEELVARIRAALRRVTRPISDSASGVFACGRLRIDHAARRVFVADAEIHLTPIEYKLLAVLAARPGRIVTRKQLLLEVWGPHNTSETQYLRVYMTHLRRKLEPAGRDLLRTEAGVGYGLECPEAQSGP